MNPTSFETSWTEAEQAAFDLLCTATGTASGSSAFLGANPDVLNAWHFNCGKISTGGEVFYADDIPGLCLPAYAEAVFLRRAACQTWAMRILAALPVTAPADSNLCELRVQAAGLGEVTRTTVQLRNEPNPVPVWTLRLDFDLVFHTGGKANSAMAPI